MAEAALDRSDLHRYLGTLKSLTGKKETAESSAGDADSGDGDDEGKKGWSFKLPITSLVCVAILITAYWAGVLTRQPRNATR